MAVYVTDPVMFTRFDNGDFETAWATAPYPQNIVTHGYIAYGTSQFQRSGLFANTGSFSGEWSGISGASINSHFLTIDTGKNAIPNHIYEGSIYFRFVPGGFFNVGDQIFLDFRLGGGPVVSKAVQLGNGAFHKVDLTYISSNIGSPNPLRLFITTRRVSSVIPDALNGAEFYFDTGASVESVDTTLQANISKTDVTTQGGTDGSITTQVTSGSGFYQLEYLSDSLIVSLNSGTNPQGHTRSSLPAGTYSVKVTDLLSSEELILTVTVIEPGAPPTPDETEGNFLQVPLLNSISFVVSPVMNPNSCTGFQQLDNVLFCNQVFPYFAKGFYAQKLQTCDSPIVQFNSNFSQHSVDIRNYFDDTVVKTFSIVLSEQNTGLVEQFNITIRNHIGFIGKSRVYFNVGAIPIPLEVDDQFEIINNLDGFNGVYLITDIVNDTLLSVQYLVINKAYTAPNPTSSAVGKFIKSNADFNVYESSIVLSDVPEGLYYMKIRAFDNVTNFKEAISEPISLKILHPDTNLLGYRNTDNAFDMTFTTGYNGMVRVESLFFKRIPGGERVMSRNSDFSLHKVNAKKQRILIFETFKLPPWLHEKLSCIFDLDFFTVNGIQCQASEGYGEPQYITRYPLANSSIKLEQVGWFSGYNSTGISSVNDGGFIIANQGFLKR